MSAPQGLVEKAATLLEADPAIARTLGVRGTAAIGHLPILPVFGVQAGAWTPPERARLGAGTIALVVLDGLLLAEDGIRSLLGQGDVFAPWDEARRWTACTRLRLVVIGHAYAEALQPWPGAAIRLRAHAPPRATVPTAASGSLGERLLDLLWRVALRWGALDAAGVALPAALDLRALSVLLDAAEPDVALAVAALRDRGALLHAGATWLLPAAEGRSRADDPQGRRDALRSRAAVQLALARTARDECIVLCEQLELELRRRSES